MSHSRPHGPPSLWHQSPAARHLLDDLHPRDVRLTLVRSGPGPDRLDWHPDGNHGATTFAALEHLRQQAVGPAFALAYDDCARAAALGAAQRAPTVAGAVAARFGNPARWLGFGPVEATRRFRANWQGCVSPCTTTEQSSPDRASKLRPAATYPQDWQTRP